VAHEGAHLFRWASLNMILELKAQTSFSILLNTVRYNYTDFIAKLIRDVGNIVLNISTVKNKKNVLPWIAKIPAVRVLQHSVNPKFEFLTVSPTFLRVSMGNRILLNINLYIRDKKSCGKTTSL
jgi:hypothetical protein